MAPPLTPREIARELAEFEVELDPAALARLATYLELLLRWNQRLNLTGLREPRALVRRLFGESLYVARVVELRGRLVDVGSGAGFPGLALKLVAPQLEVVLIEARHRKCTFLKEVVRACGFSGVEVVTRRFEEWVETAGEGAGARLVTTRAVIVGPGFLRLLGRVLVPGGQAIFLTTPKLAEQIRNFGPDWQWLPEVSVPGSTRGKVLIGSST